MVTRFRKPAASNDRAAHPRRDRASGGVRPQLNVEPGVSYFRGSFDNTTSSIQTVPFPLITRLSVILFSFCPF